MRDRHDHKISGQQGRARSERIPWVAPSPEEGDGDEASPETAAPRESERHLSRVSAALDDLIFFLFLAALGWAPFWFGSDRSLAWGVNAIWFGGLVIAFELVRIISGRRHPVAFYRIWFPAMACLVVFGWTLIQIAHWIPAGYHNPIWQMAREASGRDIAGSITVNRDATVLAATRFLTCCAAFWLALQLCRSSARAQSLVRFLALAGAAYAAYGIVAFFVFPNTILWFDKVTYNDSLTSTFVNRNSYATYAGLGLMSALGILLNFYISRGEGKAAAISRRLAGLLALTVAGGALWIAVVLVIGTALVLTGSRGGVSASLGGLLTILVLAGVRGRKNAIGAGFGLLIGGLAMGVALFNYGDFLADRLTINGFASDDRLAVYGLTWRSILDAPLFGFGDGTFSEVFPMYRDSTIGPFGVWDMAHNSYLEALQGLGVPVAVLLFLGLGSLFVRCVLGAIARRRAASAPLVACAATVIVALHAFVDFSVQMQAVALTWVALLGAGVAQSWSGSVATDR
ncbi:O-antigen ligase [Methylosinus sp. sav-2]|nr:O-antigen ligase [Methylosinus sp. sav-2]